MARTKRKWRVTERKPKSGTDTGVEKDELGASSAKIRKRTSLTSSKTSSRADQMYEEAHDDNEKDLSKTEFKKKGNISDNDESDSDQESDYSLDKQRRDIGLKKKDSDSDFESHYHKTKPKRQAREVAQRKDRSETIQKERHQLRKSSIRKYKEPSSDFESDQSLIELGRERGSTGDNDSSNNQQNIQSAAKQRQKRNSRQRNVSTHDHLKNSKKSTIEYGSESEIGSDLERRIKRKVDRQKNRSLTRQSKKRSVRRGKESGSDFESDQSVTEQGRNIRAGQDDQQKDRSVTKQKQKSKESGSDFESDQSVTEQRRKIHAREDDQQKDSSVTKQKQKSKEAGSDFENDQSVTEQGRKIHDREDDRQKNRSLTRQSQKRSVRRGKDSGSEFESDQSVIELGEERGSTEDNDSSNNQKNIQSTAKQRQRRNSRQRNVSTRDHLKNSKKSTIEYGSESETGSDLESRSKKRHLRKRRSKRRAQSETSSDGDVGHPSAYSAKRGEKVSLSKSRSSKMLRKRVLRRSMLKEQAELSDSMSPIVLVTRLSQDTIKLLSIPLSSSLSQASTSWRNHQNENFSLQANTTKKINYTEYSDIDDYEYELYAPKKRKKVKAYLIKGDDSCSDWGFENTTAKKSRVKYASECDSDWSMDLYWKYKK